MRCWTYPSTTWKHIFRVGLCVGCYGPINPRYHTKSREDDHTLTPPHEIWLWGVRILWSLPNLRRNVKVLGEYIWGFYPQPVPDEEPPIFPVSLWREDIIKYPPPPTLLRFTKNIYIMNPSIELDCNEGRFLNLITQQGIFEAYICIGAYYPYWHRSCTVDWHPLTHWGPWKYYGSPWPLLRKTPYAT